MKPMTIQMKPGDTVKIYRDWWVNDGAYKGYINIPCTLVDINRYNLCYLQYDTGETISADIDDVQLIHSAEQPRVRGFEICSGFEETAALPTRATRHSAGYDFRVPVGQGMTIEPHETAKFLSGIKAYMLPDEFLGIHVRSSIGIKKGLVLSNSVAIVDADFYGNPENEGNIMIALTNTSDQPQTIEDNERIAQGIFYKYLKTDCDYTDGERKGGIGSSGT